MNLLDLFRKKTKQEKDEEEETEKSAADLESYSGMAVEVTALDGHLLFIAKLLEVRGNAADLRLGTAMTAPSEADPIPVRLRGYDDHERKSVCMEGAIAPKLSYLWHVENLTITKIGGNERAFFRLSTNIDATMITFGGGATSREKPCKLLNISAGGVCVGSEHTLHKNDKFLLKVTLLENSPPSAIFCQILRITEKGQSNFEYGCQFLNLSEEAQEKIAQYIFAEQIKQRGNSY